MKILYYGPLSDNSGYAAAARGYVKALRAACGDKAEIKTIHYKIDPTPYELDEVEKSNCLMVSPDFSAIKNKVLEQECDILINHVTPELSFQHQKAFNVMCNSWETDRICQKWVDDCNLQALIFVSCQDNHSAYLRSGVNTPIEVMPLACDTSRYSAPYKNLLTQNIVENLAKYKVKFYSIFHFTPKKGFDVLLKAYYRAFTGNDEVCLLVKTYLNGKNPIGEGKQIAKYVGEIRNSMRLKHYPTVLLLPNVMTDDAVDDIHKAGDVFVLPSRAEGWCVPAFDAAAFGKWPICVGYGGTREFIQDHKNGVLLPYEMQPLTNVSMLPAHIYDSHQNWAEPSLNRLIQEMQYVYENIEQHRGGYDLNNDPQRQESINQYSYVNVGQKLLTSIMKGYDSYVKQKEQKIKTSENKKTEAQTIQG